MDVILTEDVVGVGDIGERVKVRPGFARNYLIPRGFAVEAGTSDARKLAHQMRQVEAKRRKLKGSAESLAQKVRDLTINLELRVGAHGKVFGSITTRDIADQLKGALGNDFDRRRVLLSEPIKKVGTHFVRVKLHSEVEATAKVIVSEVAATVEDEEKAVTAVKEALESRSAEFDEDSDSE